LQGTYIIPLLTSVLQDKSQWEKPDAFYPEHFLDANGKFVKKDAFMPFSAGAFSFPFTAVASTDLRQELLVPVFFHY